MKSKDEIFVCVRNVEAVLALGTYSRLASENGFLAGVVSALKWVLDEDALPLPKSEPVQVIVDKGVVI